MRFRYLAACVVPLVATPAVAQQSLGFKWGLSAGAWVNEPGRRITGYCPPGGVGTIYGTDVYTADSFANVHQLAMPARRDSKSADSS